MTSLPTTPHVSGGFVRWPCSDGCRSEYRAWDAPTGSMVTCVSCARPLCVDCQTEPAYEPFARCHLCDGAVQSIRADSAAAEYAARFRPCINQCITDAKAWDLAHPGEYQDHSDGASSRCLNCDNHVCIYCMKAPAPVLFVPCPACSRRIAADDPGHTEQWDPAASAELHRLAGRLASAGGGTFAQVNGWINRRMGVRRWSEADADQLKSGAEMAVEWLRRLVEGRQTDPARWEGLMPQPRLRGRNRRP